MTTPQNLSAARAVPGGNMASQSVHPRSGGLISPTSGLPLRVDKSPLRIASPKTLPGAPPRRASGNSQRTQRRKASATAVSEPGPGECGEPNDRLMLQVDGASDTKPGGLTSPSGSLVRFIMSPRRKASTTGVGESGSGSGESSESEGELLQVDGASDTKPHGGKGKKTKHTSPKRSKSSAVDSMEKDPVDKIETPKTVSVLDDDPDVTIVGEELNEASCAMTRSKGHSTEGILIFKSPVNKARSSHIFGNQLGVPPAKG